MVSPAHLYNSMMWSNTRKGNEHAFWILDFLNVDQTPLERLLLVNRNASFGCLGVPGVDFG